MKPWWSLLQSRWGSTRRPRELQTCIVSGPAAFKRKNSKRGGKKRNLHREGGNKKARNVWPQRQTAPCGPPMGFLLLLCCCFAAALLLLCCCFAAALLLLCCCLAAALLLLCCLAAALLLPCCCLAAALLLPCCCLAAALLLPCCCLAAALLLPCCCLAAALLLPCCCLAAALLLPCCCLAAALLLPCCCLAAALLLPCCCLAAALLRPRLMTIPSRRRFSWCGFAWYSSTSAPENHRTKNNAATTRHIPIHAKKNRLPYRKILSRLGTGLRTKSRRVMET